MNKGLAAVVVFAFASSASLALALENAADVSTNSTGRSSHPSAATTSALQVLASDGPVWQLRYLGTPNESADPSWHIIHPNGPTIREFQAMSLEAAAWHPLDTTGDPGDAAGAITRAWVYQMSVTDRSSANCAPGMRFYGLLCPPSDR